MPYVASSSYWVKWSNRHETVTKRSRNSCALIVKLVYENLGHLWRPCLGCILRKEPADSMGRSIRRVRVGRCDQLGVLRLLVRDHIAGICGRAITLRI